MAKLTPMKAIRAKCLECSSGQFKEIRLCPVKKLSSASTETDIDRKTGKISLKTIQIKNRKLQREFLVRNSSKGNMLFGDQKIKKKKERGKALCRKN